MRLYVNGVKDYLQWKTGHAQTPWKMLIDARLKETTVSRERLAERIAREKAVALEIAGMEAAPEEKLRLWREKTGRSERAYWRRLEKGQPPVVAVALAVPMTVVVLTVAVGVPVVVLMAVVL